MKLKLAAVAALASLLLAATAMAQSADASLDPLLRLLVQNKVITLDQAMAVQAEYNAQKTAQVATTVAAVQKTSEVTTKYELGKGIQWKKGDMSLKIGGYAQALYSSSGEDGDAIGKVFGQSREGKDDTFDLRRARISFEGTLTKYVNYKLETDVAGGSAALREGTLGMKTPLNKFFIWGGQGKVPFGREAINSSSELEFVDRSVVDNFFHPEYDRGVSFGGQLGKKQQFGWQAGIFNSEGENKRNDDGDNRYAARVNFDPFGYYKPSQADIGRSKDPKLSFAVDYMKDDLAKVGEQRESYGVDFALAWRGFFLDGEWVTADHDFSGPDNSFSADGWHLQAGFMVYKDMVEISARYASLDADFPGDDMFVGEGPDWIAGRGFKTLGKTTAGAGGTVDGAIYDQLDITTLGVSFYFDGHANKLQLDYNWVNEDGFGAGAHSLDNDILRVQYQIKF